MWTCYSFIQRIILGAGKASMAELRKFMKASIWGAARPVLHMLCSISLMPVTLVRQERVYSKRMYNSMHSWMSICVTYWTTVRDLYFDFKLAGAKKEEATPAKKNLIQKLSTPADLITITQGLLAAASTFNNPALTDTILRLMQSV